MRAEVRAWKGFACIVQNKSKRGKKYTQEIKSDNNGANRYQWDGPGERKRLFCASWDFLFFLIELDARHLYRTIGVRFLSLSLSIFGWKKNMKLFSSWCKLTSLKLVTFWNIYWQHVHLSSVSPSSWREKGAFYFKNIRWRIANFFPTEFFFQTKELCRPHDAKPRLDTHEKHSQYKIINRCGAAFVRWQIVFSRNGLFAELMLRR